MRKEVDAALGFAIIVVAPIINFLLMVGYLNTRSKTALQCFSLDSGPDCPDASASTTARIVFFLVLFVAGAVGAALVRSKWLLALTLVLGLPFTLVAEIWSSLFLWALAVYLLPEVLGIIAGSVWGLGHATGTSTSR